MNKKLILKPLIIVIDIFLSPFTFIAAFWLKLIRLYNVGLFETISTTSKKIFYYVGVFPVSDHYYEPFSGSSAESDSYKRSLPGIKFDIENQLLFLENLKYQNELIEISTLPVSPLNYSFFKGPFRSGDAEILYNIVRFLKPKKIIEIGCGHSSLLIQHAVANTSKAQADYRCHHICIEPYEAGYLSELEVEFVKKPVEKIEFDLFEALEDGDILFIDSSHIIRPGGDVLFEYLEILPRLKKGVYIHIHDIFSPNGYLKEWVEDGVNFWNEQYLLEAFLSCNDSFKVVCSVNLLKNSYYTKLKEVCPFLSEEREPGSFWIQRV
jgi:hypothetical protein